MLVPLSRCNGIGKRERRLACPRCADEERIGTPLQATAQKLIQLGVPARGIFADEVRVMLSGNQSREYSQPAGLDHEVMEAAAKLNAAHFQYAHPPPLSAIFDRQL